MELSTFRFFNFRSPWNEKFVNFEIQQFSNLYYPSKSRNFGLNISALQIKLLRISNIQRLRNFQISKSKEFAILKSSYVRWLKPAASFPKSKQSFENYYQFRNSHAVRVFNFPIVKVFQFHNFTFPCFPFPLRLCCPLPAFCFFKMYIKCIKTYEDT